MTVLIATITFPQNRFTILIAPRVVDHNTLEKKSEGSDFRLEVVALLIALCLEKGLALGPTCSLRVLFSMDAGLRK